MKRRFACFWIWMTDRWWPRKSNIFYCLKITPLLFATGIASATTVVVLWTPGRIIIASDSRKTITGGPATSECKIKREDGIHFATAGLFEFRIANFYAPDVIHRVYERSANKGPNSLRSELNLEMTNALLSAREAVSTALARDPNFNISEVVLVGVDSGVLQAVYVQTDISATLKVAKPGGGFFWASSGEFGTIPSGRPYRAELIAIGARDAIIEYQVSHPGWESMDPVAAARMFVQMEIERHPDHVGPPISVLVIEGDGSARWIDRGVCVQE
jgi:hypothetical protein